VLESFQYINRRLEQRREELLGSRRQGVVDDPRGFSKKSTRANDRMIETTRAAQVDSRVDGTMDKIPESLEI